MALEFSLIIKKRLTCYFYVLESDMQLFYVTLSFTLVVLIGLLLFHVYQSRLLARKVERKLQDFQQNILRSDMMGFYREMESYASMMESKVDEYRGLVNRLEKSFQSKEEMQETRSKTKSSTEASPKKKTAMPKTASSSKTSVKTTKKAVAEKVDTEKKVVAPKEDETKKNNTERNSLKEHETKETGIEKQSLKKATKTTPKKKISVAKSESKPKTKRTTTKPTNQIEKKQSTKDSKEKEKEKEKEAKERIPEEQKPKAETSVKKTAKTDTKAKTKTAAKTTVNKKVASKKTIVKEEPKTAKTARKKTTLKETADVSAEVVRENKVAKKTEIETKHVETVQKKNTEYTPTSIEDSTILIEPQEFLSNNENEEKDENENKAKETKNKKPQTELQRKSDRLLQMIAQAENDTTDANNKNNENLRQDKTENQEQYEEHEEEISFTEDAVGEDVYFSSITKEESINEERKQSKTPEILNNEQTEMEEIKNILWSDWRDISEHKEKIVEAKQIEADTSSVLSKTEQEQEEVSSQKVKEENQNQKKKGTLVSLMRGVGKAVKPILSGKEKNSSVQTQANDISKQPEIEQPQKPIEGDFSGLLAKEMGIEDSLYTKSDYNNDVILPDYSHLKDKKQETLTKREQALEDAKDAFLPSQQENINLDYRETHTYKMLEDMSSSKKSFSDSEKLKRFTEKTFLPREDKDKSNLIEKKVTPTEFSRLIKNLQDGRERADSLRRLMDSGFNLNEIENLSGVSYSELSLIRSLYNL